MRFASHWTRSAGQIMRRMRAIYPTAGQIDTLNSLRNIILYPVHYRAEIKLNASRADGKLSGHHVLATVSQ